MFFLFSRFCVVDFLCYFVFVFVVPTQKMVLVFLVICISAREIPSFYVFLFIFSFFAFCLSFFDPNFVIFYKERKVDRSLGNPTFYPKPGVPSVMYHKTQFDELNNNLYVCICVCVYYKILSYACLDNH